MHDKATPSAMNILSILFDLWYEVEMAEWGWGAHSPNQGKTSWKKEREGKYVRDNSG